MKTISYPVIIMFLIITQSCINTSDEPDRTEEIENQEIKSAIDKLHSKGYDVDTTALGVYYVISKTGTGPLPQNGDSLSLIYTGFFLDGSVFDASYFHYTDSLWKFNYKEINLIPGFDDGIALLNKGAAADIIIPSSLAYGASGNTGIPPYTPLVFSLIMRDLKPKKK